MVDGVDSSKNHVGDVFHASLETDLTVNNAIVARKGADVYGRLAKPRKLATCPAARAATGADAHRD